MSKNDTSHVRVYLVDSHPAIREALRYHFENTIDMEICGEAGTADTAFREIERLNPDVTITELSLPDGHGITLIQNVRAQCEGVHVIVFSMYHEDVYAERTVRAGAVGYVMKSEPIESVARAIRTAQDGDVYLSRRMSAQIITKISAGQSSKASFPVDELTEREMAVFQMLGQGFSVGEIQERLSLTRKTVETHRRRAKEKLGLDTVAELLQYAVQWTYGQGMHGTVPAVAGRSSREGKELE